MQSFKKILLVDPGSRGRSAAIRRALDLAEANGGELTLFAVLESLPGILPWKLPGFRRRETESRALSDLRAELNEAPKEDARQGVRTTAKAVSGPRVAEVLREVESGGHDLVMITAEGKGSVWFGPFATHLLRRCPCPVWAMRPVPRRRYARILAAIDLDPDASGPSLCRRILEIASGLAKMDGSELHVAHVWGLAGEAILRRRAALSDEELESVQEETREHHGRWLEVAVAPFQEEGLPVRRHLLRGRPGVKIPALIRKKHFDLLVMGTVGRSGLEGLLIGNTAERVLNEVECPVLAVKPPGFGAHS